MFLSVVWSAEWQGWDDFLGVMLPFDEARALLRSLGVSDQAELEALKAASADMERSDPSAWNGGHALRTREADGPDLGRVPVKPDLYDRAEWAGWSDFTGS